MSRAIGDFKYKGNAELAQDKQKVKKQKRKKRIVIVVRTRVSAFFSVGISFKVHFFPVLAQRQDRIVA